MTTSAQAGPGGARAAFDKRVQNFALWCLVLGAVECLYCIYRVPAQFFTGPMMKTYFDFLSSAAPHAPMTGMAASVETFVRRIAIGEAIRTLPFLACSAALVWLALRLRRGDLGALGGVRRWTFAAGATLVFSLTMQLVVMLPAIVEYTDAIVKTLPMPPTRGGAQPPFDVREMMRWITIGSTVMSLGFGTLVMAIFPIAAFVWSGRLERGAAELAAT